MTCPNCDTPNRAGARFCRVCGGTLGNAPDASTATVEQPAPDLTRLVLDALDAEEQAESTTPLPELPAAYEHAAAPLAPPALQPPADEAVAEQQAAEAGAAVATLAPPAVDEGAAAAAEPVTSTPADGDVAGRDAVPVAAEALDAPDVAPAAAAMADVLSGAGAEAQAGRGDLELAGGYGGLAAASDAEITTSLDQLPQETPTPATEAKMTMGNGRQRETRKLVEEEAQEVAPPVPGDPFAALAQGALVGGRYRVQQVLQTGPRRQTYQAADEKGFERCWACGSTANEQGETYCTDCGAQLSGRVYLLYETPPAEPIPELPDALYGSTIPAVAQVVDTLTDAQNGRHYLLVEETGGKPLSALIAGAAAEDGRPSQERMLNWMTQIADLLAQLHRTGAIGCDFSPDSLHVLPDERIALGDPLSCRFAGPNEKDGFQADTQRVSAALEQIYLGLSGLPMDKTPAEVEGDSSRADLAAVLRKGRAGEYRNAAQLASALRDIFDVTVPPRDLQLVSGRATDVGVQRELNEDSLLVLEFLAMEAAGSLPVGIYIVADGMGGHQSGEVASSIAIRTVGSILQNRVLAGQVTGEDHLPDPERTAAVVREAVLEANRRIADLARQRRSDMGTTITLALVIGNQATIANVGDSRTYLWREGRLEQISRDHSLVARLVAAGQLSSEESRYFERRNEIYLALGDPALTADQIDVYHRTVRPFDGLFLCSDGMWEMVPDVQMERIIKEAPDISVAAQTLVSQANKNGGEDNITVIIALAVINQQQEASKEVQS